MADGTFELRFDSPFSVTITTIQVLARGMQFDDFSAPESEGWGVVSPKTGDIVSNALKKEKVLKDILSYQEDLRVMLSKVDATQKEVDKLVSSNETLQMYIDNLTVQMAKRR